MVCREYSNSEYYFRFYINYGKKSFQEIKREERDCEGIVNLWYYDMNEFTAAKTKNQILKSTAADVILDGKPVHPLMFAEFGICINDNGELHLGTPKGQKNYCIGLPPQYIDGKPYCVKDFVPRNGATHIGFMANGNIVVAIAGKDSGMTNDEMNAEMLAHGCIHILRFDGSWSSRGDLGGGIVIEPSEARTVQSYLLICRRGGVMPTPPKEEESTMKIIEPDYKWAYRPGERTTTTHLILHHAAWSECTAETIHRAHLGNGWAGIAYHYFIRKDGSIYRGRPEEWTGGHTANWNYCSIGICFEGNFESEFMSEAQMEAGQALVADIRSRYPDIIVGKHKDYGCTACPGKNFPFTFIVNPETGNPEDEGSAEDYGASAWAEKDCKWAVDIGLFKGDGAGNYNWQDPVTREAMAAVLHRLAAFYRLL